MTATYTTPTIILKVQTAYKIWHSIIILFPKIHRYSLGTKIDTLFVNCISDIHLAINTKDKTRPILIKRASMNLDTTKFLLGIGTEINAIKLSQFEHLIKELDECSKILSGWYNKALKESEKH